MTRVSTGDLNMKRLFGLTLALTAGLSVASAQAAGPERIRGTVVGLSGGTLTVHTATGGDVSIVLASDTAYLTEARSDLNHLPTGSYLGIASKNVGEKLVALDVLIFPPAMKGAAEGHFDWDKVADTTTAGTAGTSSTMTNGSVATAETAPASAIATMTNGSVTAETALRGARQLKLTYKGGEQTILVPPTAAIVTLQPGAVSDLKPGDVVFVNALADGGKSTAKLILVGAAGVAPPI
jgi:hypothetical protein